MDNHSFEDPGFVEAVGRIDVWYCSRKTVKGLTELRNHGIIELEQYFAYLDNAVSEGYAERVTDADSMDVASESYRPLGWVMVSFMDEKSRPIVEEVMKGHGLQITYEPNQEH
jgi:hypothetical protein